MQVPSHAIHQSWYRSSWNVAVASKSTVLGCKGSRSAYLGKDSLVGRALLHGTADLVEVFCPGQFIVTVGVQEAKVAV